jgi:hypothetical protein
MAKVEIKKIKTDVGGEDISELFNQMLGTGNVNVDIAYPKYRRMLASLEQVGKMLSVLARSPSLGSYSAEIYSFVDQINAVLAAPQVDFEGRNVLAIDDEGKVRFSSVYKTLKESAVIDAIIVLTDNLAKYKRHFVGEKTPKFIAGIPGAWRPFPFSQFDVKSIAGDAGAVELVLLIFEKLYAAGLKIYEDHSSPDLDIDRLAEVIVENLDKLSNQPELNRCKRAFKKIRQSVDLLKTNFSAYYRNFVSTKNSTVMVENFIADICKGATSSDFKLKIELMQIIRFYKKKTEGRGLDPKLSSALDKMMESLNKLDAKTKNINEENQQEPDEPCEDCSSEEETVTGVGSAENLAARQRAAAKTVEDLAAEIEHGEKKKKR